MIWNNGIFKVYLIYIFIMGAITLTRTINNHNHYLILCISNILKHIYFYTMLFSIYKYTYSKKLESI